MVTGRPKRTRGRWLSVALAGAMVAASSLAVLDAHRESAAALDDFAAEQASIADGLAEELEARMEIAPGIDARTAFAAARRVERPGAVRVLLEDEGTLVGVDGAAVACPAITRAAAVGSAVAWLDRAEAQQLGLPERRAAAGLARAGGPDGPVVAVVGSAERVRDREDRASVRLALTASLTAGFVFLFGAIARRNQRRELELEREIALGDLERSRDATLGHASRVATLGTLAMGVAHEVSTPLGVIVGRAEQLAARAVDERSARAARGILDESEKIRGVVRGFLDLARGGPPALAEVDARAVVRDAVDLVKHRFDKARVEIALTLPEAPAPARADVVMLRQAIANLLLNACDASARGGGVEARVELSGERVVIAVLDDGDGIPPEVAARAHELFFTTKPAGAGTGLGLAIATEIVKLHRGSLSLAPRSPRGTRAVIDLPRSSAEDAGRRHGA